MAKGKDLQILIDSPAGELSPVAALADIPEEDIWLVKQKSKRGAVQVTAWEVQQQYVGLGAARTVLTVLANEDDRCSCNPNSMIEGN